MSCVVGYKRSTDSFIVVVDGKFVGTFCANHPMRCLVPVLDWMAQQALKPDEYAAYQKESGLPLHS